jgi:hypothetical protein
MLGKNKYGVSATFRGKKGKIPARCNKRSCQTRRSLTKYPEEMKHWPKCKVNGCDGKMYVDKLRLQAQLDKEKYKKDSGEPCKCDGYPIKHIRGQHKLCEGRDEVQLEKALTKGTFKHSPIKGEDLIDGECPF